MPQQGENSMNQRIIVGTCALALAALTQLLACSSTKDTPPARLALVSQDIKDGTLALHKGDSSLVGVKAYDADGQEVEPGSGDYSWISEDSKVLTAKTLGSAALIRGESDWFDTVEAPADADGGTNATAGTDAGSGIEIRVPIYAKSIGEPAVAHEPTTTLRVIYGTGSDAPFTTVQVAIVIDATGRWQADVEGVGAQELTLDQHGRNVSMVGSGTKAEGIVTGNTFSLSQQGFVLRGTFSSRTDIAGTYTGPAGVTGKWTARKIQ
jgi:hypothetical protein